MRGSLIVPGGWQLAALLLLCALVVACVSQPDMPRDTALGITEMLKHDIGGK